MDQGYLHLHEPILLRWEGEIIETTPGRAILNEIVPEGVPYDNLVQNKKSLGRLVGRCFKSVGIAETALFLDELKRIGFTYATQAGITVSIDDVKIPDEKPELVAKGASDAVEGIRTLYKKGAITETERYNRIIDTWTKATSEVEEATFRGLAKDRSGFNPIFMMADSGARGSQEQIRQLAGMRGLMAKPQKKITGGMGEIIESPVIRNFKEGLTVLEYFISTHGARKGLADTALKTADAGYLTRRLVDVAQDVIITQSDCGTILGIERGALKEGEEVLEALSERILGRTSADDVYSPLDNKLLVEAGGEINEVIAAEIEDSGIEKIRIRSVLTCESKRGACANCYGRNLARGKVAELGEAVGVVAAQSIGEPGTQLTLRTFHVGGIAARIVEQSHVNARVDGSARFKGVTAVERKAEGHWIVTSHKGEIELLDEEGRVRNTHKPPYGSMLLVVDGQKIEAGEIIFEWDTYNTPILSERNGVVRFGDIKERVTVREEVDENSGRRTQVIIDDKEKVLQPHIDILGSAGQRLAHAPLPTGAALLVKDGQKLQAGDPVAQLRRNISKTRDITGGLPRVSELFEARKPKDAATVTEIDGTISFGGITRGMRKMVVTNENGDSKDYLIPQGKHMLVQEGGEVTAGDRLTDGPINPHDILRIKGIKEVQEYLVEEIQEVYRLQGVGIDDKHIEVVVRQMLQKVRIEDPGDSTTFLEGDQVDKIMLREENGRIEGEGGQPATYVPLLLGITKASLSTQSFISAASFQETTRILTEASIRGSVDYLRGLKENVTIGNLIPAGTGIQKYRPLKTYGEREASIDFLDTETMEVSRGL